jgi:altronate dehydratase
VFKNKVDCKNAKNYRGITVTPTLSKIIEKILKIRENGKILLNQNPRLRALQHRTLTLHPT